MKFGEKLNNIGFYIVVLLIFLLIDIFARYLYGLSWFSFVSLSYELDAFDIIDLTITSILTIIIAILITKRLSEQRFIKEFIINDIKKIEDEITIISSQMDKSRIPLDDNIQNLQRFNLLLTRYGRTLIAFKIYYIKEDNLTELYNKLYKLMTNTDSDSLELNETNRLEIITLCNDFIVTLRENIYRVNNH